MGEESRGALRVRHEAGGVVGAGDAGLRLHREDEVTCRMSSIGPQVKGRQARQAKHMWHLRQSRGSLDTIQMQRQFVCDRRMLASQFCFLMLSSASGIVT